MENLHFEDARRVSNLVFAAFKGEIEARLAKTCAGSNMQPLLFDENLMELASPIHGLVSHIRCFHLVARDVESP